MMRSTDLDSYLKDAQRWEQDLVARAESSRQRAYWVAASFGVIAALTLFALVALSPMKTVEPFVVRVDNTTGITDVVPMYAGKGEISEVVSRYLLNTYVTTRERYFYAMAESDYNVIGAFNNPILNTSWMQSWDRANPDSPLNKYKDGTAVRAQVKSITFIKRADGTKDLAQVRFLTASRAGGAGAETVQHFISTIQYGYVAPSKDEQLRALNPLGFRVLEYRREPELAPDPVAGSSGNVGGTPR